MKATLDAVEILNGPLRAETASPGHVGLQLYAPGIAFRNIRLRELQANRAGIEAAPPAVH